MIVKEFNNLFDRFQELAIINERNELLYFGQWEHCPLFNLEVISIYTDNNKRLIVKVENNEN